MTTQHTPGKWEIIGRIQGSRSVEIRVVPLSDWSHEVRPSIIVKGDGAAERAQFIVTACNAHEAFIAAATEVIQDWQELGHVTPEAIANLQGVMVNAKAAQAKE